MAIVAIDQGTSGTKALVIGETGEVLSRGYAHLDLQHGAPGVSECAPEDMWQSIVKAIKQALDGCTEKITAVGLQIKVNQFLLGIKQMVSLYLR
jgi:glycerol kinase